MSDADTRQKAEDHYYSCLLYTSGVTNKLLSSFWEHSVFHL